MNATTTETWGAGRTSRRSASTPPASSNTAGAADRAGVALSERLLAVDRVSPEYRTLIAAELVFGASAGQGGLGWYIFQNRDELYTDRVFAGLVAVIVIGLLVEHLMFDTLER